MAMDEDIRASLSDIRTDVKDGFSGVNGRIDMLVTKGEFDATVQRLDSQHDSLRREFNTHEGATANHMAQVRADDSEIRKEFKGELEGFKATTRWAIGLSATGAAILVSLVQWLFSIK